MLLPKSLFCGSYKVFTVIFNIAPVTKKAADQSDDDSIPSAPNTVGKNFSSYHSFEK